MKKKMKAKKVKKVEKVEKVEAKDRRDGAFCASHHRVSPTRSSNCSCGGLVSRSNVAALSSGSAPWHAPEGQTDRTRKAAPP